MEKDKEVKLGNLYGFDGGNFAGNVYDRNALSPTIRTYQGGNQQPLVMENLRNEKRRENVIVAMRGRNPNDPSDRMPGIFLEQRLEVNKQGICNCLTSVQKDNLVMEILYDFYNQKVREDSLCGTITANGNVSFTHCGTFGIIQVNQATRNERVPDRREVCRIENNANDDPYTLVYEDGEYIYYIRIRRLIPLECWRLMGFSDEDFLKAEAVNSNTQLYKQAGNSIVKNILVAIIGQMFEGCEERYKNY